MPMPLETSVVGVRLLISDQLSVRSDRVVGGSTAAAWPLSARCSCAWMNISVSASVPTVTAMIGMPSASSISPKVSRGVAVSASMPIMATSTPKKAAASPRASDRPESAAMKVSARKVRAASSTGPMRSAIRASGSATRTSTTVAQHVTRDRGIERHLQCLLGLARLRQRIAVESGGGGVRLAGRVDQDRRSGAAGAAGLGDAHQECHRRQRRHVVGHGHGHGERCGTVEARQHAHDIPQQHASKNRKAPRPAAGRRRSRGAAPTSD